jgi:Methyltransferase domain
MTSTEGASHKQPRIVRFYRWLWRFWKERRFQRFIDAIAPTPLSGLLDIGGYPVDWFSRGAWIGRVDVLNLEQAHLENVPPEAPEIRALAGDARNLPFPDKHYDIAFSNSVIEHVGTLADQQAFANEARRVGRKLWIQTPAKGCPIEPHYLGLFVHWFPSSWHVPLARWTSFRGLTGAAGIEELRAIASTTRLLTKKEMKSLFPDCEIWTERFLLIFPKSYVAIRRR